MSLTSFFGKLFGTKAQRDYKKLQPTLAAILEEYEAHLQNRVEGAGGLSDYQ